MKVGVLPWGLEDLLLENLEVLVLQVVQRGPMQANAISLSPKTSLVDSLVSTMFKGRRCLDLCYSLQPGFHLTLLSVRWILCVCVCLGLTGVPGSAAPIGPGGPGFP